MCFFLFKAYLKETKVENFNRPYICVTDMYIPEVEVEYSVIYDPKCMPHRIELVSVKELLSHVEDHKSERFIPLNSLTLQDTTYLMHLAQEDAMARRESILQKRQELSQRAKEFVKES